MFTIFENKSGLTFPLVAPCKSIFEKKEKKKKMNSEQSK